MENKDISTILAHSVIDLKDRTEFLLKVDSDLAKEITKLLKRIERLNFKTSMSSLAIITIAAILYNLLGEYSKLNARVMALEAEKDISELEKGIDKN